MSETITETAMQIAPDLKATTRMRSPIDIKLIKIASSLEKATARRRDHSNKSRSFALKIGESDALWLLLYFTFNLGLTLFNKSVLISFPFPYTLTSLHALCGSCGGYLLSHNGAIVPSNLKIKDLVALTAFSILYSVNILASNVSLHLVTVPFHQVVRASTPVFTIIFSFYLLGSRTSQAKIASLIPVMIGVAFATYGDYYFTAIGLTLTVLGTILAALKTMYTSILQSPQDVNNASAGKWQFTCLVPPRLHLHSLDLLYRMAPLAFIQSVAYAHVSGELAEVRLYSRNEMSLGKGSALLANGVIAFGLNFVSFTANRKVGALTMTVAANVKQVLTIMCAVSIFDLQITKMNAVGILLTIVGGIWYAAVEHQEKIQSRRNR